MRHVFLACVIAFGLVNSSLAAAAKEARLAYPQTRRVDQVDVYHGVRVADPYRWLEADIRTSPEVAEWVAAENKLTASYLDAIAQRATIRRRLAELWNFAHYSPPSKHGGRYYYLKNDGLQNQSVLYVADTLDGRPRVLLDPNRWSKDGTIALMGVRFSEDGKYMAYARSEAGSDWATWRVMSVGAEPSTLPDELKWTKTSSVAWTKDDKGFFYTRFDRPARGAEYQASTLNNKLCYHRLGTPQSDDVLVYWRPEHPEWLYEADVTEDGRWLVILINSGKDENNRVLVRDLTEPYAMPVELVGNFEHQYDFVGNDGPVFFFKTNAGAPRRRLVAFNVAVAGSAAVPAASSGQDARAPGCKEIIPQTEATLAQVSFVGDRFIACYLQDVVSRMKEFAIDGRFVRDVALPGIGAAAGFGGKRAEKETFYAFSSIATPPSIYRYDIATGESHLWRRAEMKFNPDDYEVKQVFYHSKDGTRIPMFIGGKKGIKLDGSNPTLLWGYGGFNISVPPIFSVSRVVWMEMGGVYAQPTLRGGGEYGEAWHRAGTKLEKQNVFDDFIAAAEWLVAQKYTRPDKLAIEGASNGGLLVGAVMTQRPDLFGACLPAVGVMDMLRFQKFTEGRTWVDDYGSSDNPEQFKALLAYSPYHNIKPGTCYPATLVSTADTDDRVIPGHSFKFAASLQAAQSCEKPVLIRISTRSGHGGGKPVGKQIDEIADDWAFLAKNLRFTAEAQGATAGLSSSAENTVGQANRGTRKKQALPADGDKAIVERLVPICEKYNVPAIGAAIVTSDGLQAVGVVGVRKAGTNVPATINDHWHLASDTKAMTGTLVGKLVQQGKLRWDMTVAEAFPDLADGFDSEARNITLTQLLTHRSGLVGNLDWGSLSRHGSIQQQRLAAVKQGLSVKPIPGHKWLYSNLGYVTAAAVVEKVTGTSWEEAIRTELFVPLEMTSAGFGGTGTPGVIDQPWPHTSDGKPAAGNGPDVDNPAVIGPAGRVHCSLGDWAKFIADHIRGDQGKPALLKPATYKALHTPLKGECYGKGWGVSGPGITGDKEPRMLSHPGDNGMNSSLVKVWPDQDFAILVCINEDSGRAGKAIAEAVTALIALHEAQHPAKVATPGKDTN